MDGSRNRQLNNPRYPCIINETRVSTLKATFGIGLAKLDENCDAAVLPHLRWGNATYHLSSSHSLSVASQKSYPIGGILS